MTILKFLDTCTTNGNELVKYYNLFLLLFSVLILSKSQDKTIRIIFSLIYLFVILQYLIPIYLDLGQVYTESDKTQVSLGMFFITGISILLSLFLIYVIPTNLINADGSGIIYNYQYSLIAWNILLFLLPSIPAIFYTSRVKLDFTGVVKKD